MLGLCVALAAVGMLAAVGDGWRRVLGVGDREWVAGGDREVPGLFMYAMFPRGEVPFAPRAVLNTERERVDGRGEYVVWDREGREHAVDKALFGFTAGLEELPGLIAELNGTLEAWGSETDWRSAALRTQTDGSGLVYTLRVRLRRGGTRFFVYRVEGERVEPLRLLETRRGVEWPE